MKRWLPNRFKATLLWVLAGLLLGGIVHIASVLMIPYLATNDPYAIIGQFGDDAQFNVIPRASAGNEALPMLDPNMLHAACRFDISQRPLHIQIEVPARYWSMSLYTPNGLSFYSINDRAAERLSVDLRIFTGLQLTLYNEAPREDAEKQILIESPTIQGFAILRALVRDAAEEALIAKVLKQTTCSEFELPERTLPGRAPVEPIPTPKPK